MKRPAALLAASACALVGVLASPAPAAAARCGLPDAQPLWVEFAHGSVQFRDQVFRRPGIVAATSGNAVAASLRAGGAHTIYWEMNLPRFVGTPDIPADPASVPGAAAALYDRAVASSTCSTPLIALNELWGPTLPAPWTSTNAQYRANVITFLQELAARGARSYLLVPSNPNMAGDSAAWWKQAAEYADIVRQVYVKGPEIHGRGALLGSREVRLRLRRAVKVLADVGIGPERVGLMLGLQSGGMYGRVGLQPREAWLELVKWKALAARQVAADERVATVWSWGWGTFDQAGADPDKPLAACVYLWTRDPSLCDAPAAAGPGFNASLTDGQILLAPGVQCSFGAATLRTAAIDEAERLTGDRARATTALFARVVQRERARVTAAAVLRAERRVIASRFDGSRKRYRRALERRRIGLVLARQLLADELRRPALARAAGGDLAAWTVAEQTKALDVAVCLRDELPAAGDVRLAEHVAFLKLA